MAGFFILAVDRSAGQLRRQSFQSNYNLPHSAALTNDILGKIDTTSKTVSSYLPDTSGLTSQLSSLTGQLGNLYQTFESQFCTEAEFDFGEFAGIPLLARGLFRPLRALLVI